MISEVFLDIDGVLTDGAVYVDASGKETKRILFDDIDAIFKLKRAGIKIGFITGEDNEFCQYVKNRIGPDYFLAGCKDKLAAFKKCSFSAGPNRPAPNFGLKHTTTAFRLDITPEAHSKAVFCPVTFLYFFILSIYLYLSATSKFKGSGFMFSGASIGS